jgi:hypothetical protein
LKEKGSDIPYASKAQEGYFNANRAKLEKQGVDVDEWNAASKGKKLPERKGKPSLHSKVKAGLKKAFPKSR